MLKDLCRDFARKEIAPYADEWFDAEYFPVEVFRKMADRNLWGADSRKYGSGAGTMAMVAALEESAKWISQLRLRCEHLTIGLPFLHFGTEAQKHK